MSVVTDTLADVQAGAQMYDIASGNQARSKSMDAAYIAKEREAKLKQMSSNLQGTNTNNSRAEEELTLLRGKVKDMEIKQNINDGYRAYQAYDGGDSSYLNKHMKSTIPDVADVQSITSEMSKTDPETFNKTLEALNTTPEIFASLDDEQKKDLLKGYKVVTLNGGEKVINNVENWLASSGIGGMLKTQELDNLTQIELKRQAAMTPTQRAMETTSSKVAGASVYADAIAQAKVDKNWELVRVLENAAGIADKKLTPKEAAESAESSRTVYVGENPTKFTEAVRAGTMDTRVDTGGKMETLYNIAKAEQGKNKLGEAPLAMLRGKKAVVAGVKEVEKKLEKIEDWNIVDKATGEIGKVVDTSVFSTIIDKYKEVMQGDSSKEEKKAAETKVLGELKEEMSRVGLESYMFTVMADYIKAMSGAAVSEEERSAYVNNMTGNWFANKKTFQEAISGFKQGIQDSLDNMIDGFADDLPLTHLRQKKYMSKDYYGAPAEEAAPAAEKIELSAEEITLKEQAIASGMTEEEFNTRLLQYRQKAK